MSVDETGAAPLSENAPPLARPGSSPKDAGRPIIVDAALLAKWLLPEELADRAHDLLWHAVAAGRAIHAPPSVILDVADALYTHTLRDRITVTEANTALSILHDLPLVTDLPDGFWPTVLSFAREHDLRHLQVAQAIVLAEMLGGEAWTGHRDTYHDLSKVVPWLRWVGDAPEE